MKNKIITVTLNPCIDKTLELQGFVAGGLNRVQAVRSDAGGKGVNVAKALANFGADVLAVGLAGEDGYEKFTAALDAKGIPHQFVKVPGAIRTNYKLRNNITGGITEVNEPGPLVTEEVLNRFLTELRELMPETAVLVLSGSMPPGTPADFYGKLIALAGKYGTTVIADADGAPLRAAIKEQPFAIKPNMFELEQLCGRDLNSEAEALFCAHELLEDGIGLVIVSMGARGALYVTAEVAFRATPPEIKCESATAAGDSMVAAAAYALQKCLPIEELAKFCTAAGTATATCPGSEVCTMEMAEEMKEQIEVVRM